VNRSWLLVTVPLAAAALVGLLLTVRSLLRTVRGSVVASVPDQPVLTANTTVGRVIVNDAATLTIGGFNLTVNAGARTINTGKITATSGLLLLSGAGTIAGSLPRFIVTGSYALAGSVVTPATARVNGGRLNTAGWLMQVTP
jgi:hypothetical protein